MRTRRPLSHKHAAHTGPAGVAGRGQVTYTSPDPNRDPSPPQLISRLLPEALPARNRSLVNRSAHPYSLLLCVLTTYVNQRIVQGGLPHWRASGAPDGAQIFRWMGIDAHKQQALHQRVPPETHLEHTTLCAKDKRAHSAAACPCGASQLPFVLCRAHGLQQKRRAAMMGHALSRETDGSRSAAFTPSPSATAQPNIACPKRSAMKVNFYSRLTKPLQYMCTQPQSCIRTRWRHTAGSRPLYRRHLPVKRTHSCRTPATCRYV